MWKLGTAGLILGSMSAVAGPSSASTVAGDMAAAVMMLDWVLFAGMAAVVIQMPGVAAYRLVAGVEWWRALWTGAVASLAGGMAFSLTFLQPRPESWARHWITGLAVLLVVELPVLGAMNRGIPNRGRLLLTAAAAISVLYGVVLGVAHRVI